MTLSVVTGANRGIGLALAAALAKRGGHVVATCRTSSPALDALGVEVVSGVDVATDAGIAALVAAVGSRAIDLLVNNAGILVWGDQLGALNLDGIRKQFEVNALAPLRVTDALRDRLGKGAKVALITSRMGSIEDNGSGGAYGYRMSKAALNMATRSLAVDLKSRGIIVVAMHPGMVQTDLTRGFGMLTPAESVSGMNQVIDKLTLEQTGLFLHYQGTTLPW